MKPTQTLDAAPASDRTLFRQHMAAIPHLQAEHWSFVLGGLVETHLFLSYADLLALPAVEIDCVIACAGNPPGGPAFGEARWHGVPMTDILSEVEVQPGARVAHLHSADGYSTSISLEQLRKAVLVYGMNAGPLPPEHGHPARLVIPGLQGYKMPKWLQRIVLAESPIQGFWEQRGAATEGLATITAGIRQPPHLAHVAARTQLQGYAYGGDARIAQVEVSIDSGPWMPVPFTQSSVHSAAQWAIDWTPSSAGEHRISVRAADEHGNVQIAADDSSGLHSIKVYS